MTPASVIASLEEGNTRLLRENAGIEGLSEAYFERIASLLGTAPEQVQRLGRHFRLILKYGDRPAYAWRARGGALRGLGRWRESGEAFELAGRHAVEPVDKILFKLGAIDSYARAGMTDRSVAVGRAAARGLERLGEPDLAARARLNLANALIWEDRYSEAIREYEKVLKRNISAYERAAAQLGLSTSYLFHGRTRDVRSLAESAQRGFEELGLSHFAHLARLNLAQVAILQGRPEEGWSILRELAPLLEESDEHGRVLEFQADAALALNLNESAFELYGQALPLQRNPLNMGNCLLGQARSLVATGDTDQAIAYFARSMRHFRRAGNLQWELIAQMERAHERGSRRGLAKVAAALRTGGAHYWEALAWLHLASHGDTSGLIRARRLIERNGYLNLIWRLRWMEARDRGTLRSYRRMAQALLADRLTTVSIAARMGFLRDKREAMLDYVRMLLQRGTAKDLQEVVDFVQKTRSAALFDELSSGIEFQPLRARVESIRSAIRQGGPEGVRRAVAISVSGVAVDLDRVLKSHSFEGPSHALGDIWVDLGDGYAATDGQSCRFVEAKRIKADLRWLWFEMMAPLTDRTTSPGPIIKLIDRLRSQLGTISSWVCPDGALWAAPWAVLGEGETTVALNPAFGRGLVESLPPNARVAVWFHEAADLPAVSAEVASLRAAFPNATLCRTRAEAVQSLTKTWDYVHVATHARLSSSNPMFSYFEFADGPLFAIEISRSNLKVKLAVLAACDTGRLDTTLRDEPDGIVRAFLARGAQSVIAGQWPLDDEAAAVSMRVLAGELAAGKSATSALASARSATRKLFPHPYFWGALVHFAGYQTQSAPRRPKSGK